MRFIMTIIWSALISGVISYVLSNMADEAFNLTHSLILAGILALGIFVLGEGMLNESEEQ